MADQYTGGNHDRVEDGTGGPVARPTGHSLRSAWSDRRAQKLSDVSRRVGAALQLLEHNGMAVLHERAIPGTEGNIEHFVVGNQGVTIVRVAPFKGRVSVRGREVRVGGNNITPLVDGLEARIDTVRHMLGGQCRVFGALCLLNDRGDSAVVGPTTVGSAQAAVARLAAEHAATAAGHDIAATAHNLDTIFLPAALLS